MYPAYTCMDSCPYQRNQMPNTPHYHPSFEAVPPQMKVDPVRSPVTNEPWPYGGNYGYPYPMESYGCCNHNCFPASYGFRFPYPHFPPPSALHCYGNYPAFQGTYPVHYIPSPHYSMEQPRHEYDKNMLRDYHCCGCPNHSCKRKEDRNVKLEENNESLVPVEWKNHPYPVVWIPPGYMKNREQRRPIESESKERDDFPHDTKACENLKSSEREPSVWNGWFPLDTNSFGSLKQGEDDKGTQHQQNEDMARFPFPIFWMPCKPEEVERKDHKETNAGQESVEESPSHFRITPVELPDTDQWTNKPRASEENSGSECDSRMMDKNAVQKMIPVKQVQQHEEKKTSEGMEVKARDIPVKHADDYGERKPSENSAKKQSSSPPKTSKLPPVCLRVDPLPRRKNGNGSSRSPSPPAVKGKLQELSQHNSKSSTLSNVKDYSQQDTLPTSYTLDKSKEVEPSKSKTKTIEVVEGATWKDRNKNLNKAQGESTINLPINSHQQVSTSQTTTNARTGNDERIAKEDKGVCDANGKESGEQ